MSSRLSIPPHRYNLNMPPNNKSFDKKGLLADIGCLLGVIVPTLVFQCSADPVKRGFFCQDLDIRYPYHKETVSTSAAVLVALVAPVILFIIVEIQQYLSTSRSLKECMREMYGVTLVYLFGLASTTLITVLTKIMVGRHRPHFYQVCNPKSTDPDKNLCETEQSWSWTNPGIFISNLIYT